MNRGSQETDCERLKDYLIATTGLAYYVDRGELLTKAIDDRISVLGLRNCSAYANVLSDGERGSAEMDAMISLLTIGETSFFRDEAQFAAIRQLVLPDIIERNESSRRLRIWSAGCATGAEPYSLAILLTHILADRLADWQVEIRATDLNAGYLARAAEGKFRPWALRTLSDGQKRECFSNQGAIWTILPKYKEWISFDRVNLAGWKFSPPASRETRFDLILCCNVMIYFAPEVSQRLATQFHHALQDGGWLLVGPSEHNQTNYRAFHAVETDGARAYHKVPLVPERAKGAPESRPVVPAVPNLPRAHAAIMAPRVSAATAPKLLTDKAHEPSDHPGSSGLEFLRQLADRGDWQRAAEYGRKLVVLDPLNPTIHFYRALVFENLGSSAELERCLRQAIYLDRDFALAHYQLGLALKRGRQAPAAARSFQSVLKCLVDLPHNATVTGGPGVTVRDLMDLAKMQLENLGSS